MHHIEANNTILSHKPCLERNWSLKIRELCSSTNTKGLPKLHISILFLFPCWQEGELSKPQQKQIDLKQKPPQRSKEYNSIPQKLNGETLVLEDSYVPVPLPPQTPKDCQNCHFHKIKFPFFLPKPIGCVVNNSSTLIAITHRSPPKLRAYSAYPMPLDNAEIRTFSQLVIFVSFLFYLGLLGLFGAHISAPIMSFEFWGRLSCLTIVLRNWVLLLF